MGHVDLEVVKKLHVKPNQGRTNRWQTRAIEHREWNMIPSWQFQQAVLRVRDQEVDRKWWRRSVAGWTIKDSVMKIKVREEECKLAVGGGERGGFSWKTGQ